MTASNNKTTTPAPLTRAACVAALKKAGAYKGLSKASVGKLRLTVAALSVVGIVKPSKPSKPSKASKASKPSKASKAAKQDDAARCPINGARLSARQLASANDWQALIDGGATKGRKTTITHADYVALIGASKTHNARAFLPSGWLVGDETGTIRPSTCNTMHLTAMRAGYSVNHKGPRNSGVIVATKLGKKAAQAQCDLYKVGVDAYRVTMAKNRAARPAVAPSTVAARAQAVDPKRVAALKAAIKANKPSKRGAPVLLTGKMLAIAGVPASWATGGKAYADSKHVKARTMAAAGYVARSSRGQLVCTRIAKAAKATKAA